MLKKEYMGRAIVTICGLSIVILTIAIGAFLIFKGSTTFTEHGGSIIKFLFSTDWAPSDSLTKSTGRVGAGIYIVGSLLVCGLALLIATPFSLAGAIFISEISPSVGKKILQPAIEIFVGIPSVVYGWVGLTVLVPFINDKLNAPMGGYSVLAAGIVLAVMIFPTITTVSADALRAVPDGYRQAAYGLGSTRWQVIHKVCVPAARTGIMSGIILGLARAFGEALAVAMVIGKTRVLPKGLLYPTNNLTAAIAADMGNTADGGEHNAALWSMALLLLIISMLCILAIHVMANASKRKEK